MLDSWSVDWSVLHNCLLRLISYLLIYVGPRFFALCKLPTYDPMNLRRSLLIAYTTSTSNNVCLGNVTMDPHVRLSVG